MKKAKVVTSETLRPKTAVKDSRNFNHLKFFNMHRHRTVQEEKKSNVHGREAV